MKVLVTGGAGFIGSHLVDALVTRGDEVVVLDNMHRGRREFIQQQVESKRVSLIEGDIRDERTVADAAKGCDVVFHLAAQSNVMGAVHESEYGFTTNVGGTYTVIKAAATAGVRRLVFSSSRETYGEPDALPVAETAPLRPKNGYGASKVAGEAYCQAAHATYGLECQVLRFANVYGPRDSGRVIPLWLDRAQAGDELLVYGGEQVIDFVWVETAVAALLAAAEVAYTGPINVASGKGTQIKDLANRIIDVTGAKVPVTVVPARGIEVVRFIGDNSRMRSLLGVEPAGDPLEQLQEMVPARSGM